jgi:hypothetical protein
MAKIDDHIKKADAQWVSRDAVERLTDIIYLKLLRKQKIDFFVLKDKINSIQEVVSHLVLEIENTNSQKFKTNDRYKKKIN